MLNLFKKNATDCNYGHTDKTGKPAYEKYSDEHSFDEAASLAEYQHMRSRQLESLQTIRDFDNNDKEVLNSKKTSDAEKERIIEKHVYRFGQDVNLNPVPELNGLLDSSKQI